MVPLHDGSGFATVGSSVKWATKPLLNDQRRRIRKYGQGPFTVLECVPNCLLIINEHGNRVAAAKPEWLVPAKSLLTAILERMARLVSTFLTSSVAGVIIDELGRIIVSADLTNEEKNQAAERLKEMRQSLSTSGDERNARIYLDLLALNLKTK